MTTALPPLGAEWLESDGNGGYASGTVAGFRTRRYHALLLTPLVPPCDRVALVNGIEAWIDAPTGRFPLSTQHYTPDVLYPRGLDHLVAFAPQPWPRWTFRGPGDIRIRFEVLVDHDDGSVLLRWQLASAAADVRLGVRPLLSGRDYHALMRENPAFAFDPHSAGGNVSWRPYAALPAIAALTNATYAHDPLWYRNFLYRDEALRGLDHVEDLASPGTFSFDLSRSDAHMVLRAGDGIDVDSEALAARIVARESARRTPLSALDRAAEAYVVRRGAEHTILAGFPWFTDWGRDTFIAMRGLLLARGRFDLAASILLAWAATVSEGMLPNRFPDHGAAPEYNSVDASLWFVIAAHEFLAAAAPAPDVRGPLVSAVAAILDGYSRGTRYGIRADEDGLLECGTAGVQLTWMDAKVGNEVITPRIGKPVEVQALWFSALSGAGGRYAARACDVRTAFAARFPNAAAGGLYDVVDADHVAGRVDASIRPNQIFAVGGLPFRLVDGNAARAVVDRVEADLLTPLGLRTLAPGDPAYRGHYEGGSAQRDRAYHQGTAWPWLIGAFVDAWLNVHGDDASRRAAARRRFVAPIEAHLALAGLGHVSEIADGDAPHAPRGCPFQAWSLGELIRARARTS